MGWPQFVYLCWMVLGLGVALAKHGQRQDGRYSFWVSLLGFAISMALLTAGGFWR